MAAFTVAMVDYDYDSLETIKAEVVKLGGDFIARHCQDIDEAIAWAGEADGWIVQYLNPIGEKVFSSCGKLKVVGRTGIGVDPIDVPAATAHNVVVSNVPGFCLEEVSTHALALMLACLRGTTMHTNAIKRGEWSWIIGRPMARVSGLTLGLVAFGQIPRALAPKAQALGMRVLCADPYLKPEVAREAGVAPVAMDALLEESDVISIHCPLTDETRGLFNAEAFAKMKPTAYLVNTARGPIVDIPDLVAAVKTKQIAGAALDVLPTEPPDPNDPILQLDNVVLTPHIGWYSEDSIVEMHSSIGRDVALACIGKRPSAVVNPEVLDRAHLR